MFRPGDWGGVFKQVEAAAREQGRQIYQELAPLLLLRVEGRGGDG